MRSLHAFVDALYPQPCPSCGAEGVGSPCPACDGLLALRAGVASIRGVEACWALAPYAGSVGARVAHAKREGDREALASLGRLLARRAHDVVAGDWFAAVVPAPSPWTRRLRRGFAPGHVLARQVARATRRPLWSVLQVAPGRRQSTLDEEARRHNLQHRLSCPPMPPCRVLLIDDVVTSGTTLEHCAGLLRARGAQAVWALTLCDARRSAPAEPGDRP